jgi:hypothetical protein
VSSAVAAAAENDKIVVGDFISLSSTAVLKGSCTSSAGCASWPAAPTNAASATSVAARPPDLPQRPSISFSLPETISACDGFSVDLQSGARGHGGRPWGSVSLSLSALSSSSAASEVNVTEANILLAQIATAATLAQATLDASFVPASVLVPGTTYLLSSRICSFLASCADYTQRFSVLQAIALPTVSIVGEATRELLRSEALAFSADAYYVTCSGETGAQRLVDGLRYEWEMQDADGDPLSALASASSHDPSRFELSAFSLSAQSSYTLRVTVRRTGLSRTSSASVTLSVGTGHLVAGIAGGSERSLNPDSALSLDASESYDQDAVTLGVSASGAPLGFSWTCIQLEPTPDNARCPGLRLKGARNSLAVGSSPIVRGAAAKASLLTLEQALVGAVSRLTVTVFDPSDTSREFSDPVSVVIRNAPAQSPEVAMGALSNDREAQISTRRKLVLTALVRMELPGYAQWSILSPVGGAGLNLSLAALTPTVRPLRATTSSGRPTRVHLVLRPNVLQQGLSYTFALTARLGEIDKSARGMVTVVTNAPPIPGWLTVNPSSGVELETIFSLHALAWTDESEHYPLEYAFAMLKLPVEASNSIIDRNKENGNSIKVLQPRGVHPSIETELPASIGACRVIVFDSLSARSTAQTSVTVSRAAGGFSPLRLQVSLALSLFLFPFSLSFFSSLFLSLSLSLLFYPRYPHWFELETFVSATTRSPTKATEPIELL